MLTLYHIVDSEERVIVYTVSQSMVSVSYPDVTNYPECPRLLF